MEGLRLLARTYYNQDWDSIVDTADEVVDMFVDNRGRDVAEQTAGEIQAVLREIESESDLKHLWLQTLGSAFNVPSTGLTYREWFEHLVVLLTSHLQRPR